MAVQELEPPPERRRAADPDARIMDAPPRVHDLAPETVARIESILPDPGLVRAPRVAVVGASVTSLPGDLARLVSAAPGGPAPPATPEVVLVCPPEEQQERLGPDLSSLERACMAAVAAAVPGQTIIATSASYVGCTRDLLVVPLERRGLTPGEDIHVAVGPERLQVEVPGRSTGRVVGGATAACGRVAATVLGRVGAVTMVETLEAAEAACLTSPSGHASLSAAKRLYDVVGAVAALGILWPTLALVALAIFLADGRPILFTQDRVGLNGRRFRFRKFRTMAAGADGHLHEVLHLNGIRGPAFQIENDPRVTRIGRFLRASSLDELPQLWNVLVGEMSLVGPRPAPVAEVVAYRPWHLRRLSAKPGITGLAQVRARRYREFDMRAGLDLQYIDHWSPRLDAMILLRTVPAVLRFTGR